MQFAVVSGQDARYLPSAISWIKQPAERRSSSEKSEQRLALLALNFHNTNAQQLAPPSVLTTPFIFGGRICRYIQKNPLRHCC